MISLVIWLIVVLVIFGIIYGIVSQIPVAAPYRWVVLALMGLFLVIILLDFLASIPGPHALYSPLR